MNKQTKTSREIYVTEVEKTCVISSFFFSSIFCHFVVMYSFYAQIGRWRAEEHVLLCIEDSGVDFIRISFYVSVAVLTAAVSPWIMDDDNIQRN